MDPFLIVRNVVPVFVHCPYGIHIVSSQCSCFIGRGHLLDKFRFDLLILILRINEFMTVQAPSDKCCPVFLKRMIFDRSVLFCGTIKRVRARCQFRAYICDMMMRTHDHKFLGRIVFIVGMILHMHSILGVVRIAFPDRILGPYGIILYRMSRHDRIFCGRDFLQDFHIRVDCQDRIDLFEAPARKNKLILFELLFIRMQDRIAFSCAV